MQLIRHPRRPDKRAGDSHHVRPPQRARELARLRLLERRADDRRRVRTCPASMLASYHSAVHVISSRRWVVPGGRVAIDGTHLPVPADGPPHVLVGAHDAHVVGASHDRDPFRRARRRPRAARPPSASTNCRARRADLEIARPLATGSTRSTVPRSIATAGCTSRRAASRGTKVPVPLYRLGADGVREPLAVEIANPTSLALGPDGAIYVSSRFDGHVHRLTADDRVEIYATELGVPTGPGVRAPTAACSSAIDRDRFCASRPIGRSRRSRSFRPASPRSTSRSGPDGCLYVAAPTLRDARSRSTASRPIGWSTSSTISSAGRRGWRSTRPARCTSSTRSPARPACTRLMSRRPNRRRRARASAPRAGRRRVRSGGRRRARLERHGLAARRGSEAARVKSELLASALLTSAMLSP